MTIRNYICEPEKFFCKTLIFFCERKKCMFKLLKITGEIYMLSIL